MKLEKIVNIGGKWAKPNVNIQNGEIITILNEGEFIEGKYGRRIVFKIQNSAGEELNLTFNQKTINNLIDVYGNETKNWIGKQARVWIFTSPVGGEFRDVVYLAHPDWIFKNNKFQPKEEEKGDDIPIVE